MSYAPTRRQILQGGSALLAAATLGLIRPNAAFAAHDKITVRVERDLGNLDPANRTGPLDVNILNAVMQGLIAFKPGSTEWQLDAAADIKQVSDTEIDFTLRPDQAFTGGYGPLTAEDVKFSFERFITPDKSGKKVDYASDWAALDHVEVTGPLSGKIILKAPAPALWVITLADGSGRIISKKAFEQLGDKFSSTVVGSGPYVLKEWKPREQFVLEINPDYKGPIKPYFQQIIGKPIKEQKTADIAFKAGEIDFERIEPDNKKAFAALPDTSITELQGIDYVWFGPNIEKKPFDDIRVRQALRLGVDIDGILAGAYAGLYPRANALLAPGIVGYWAEAPVYKRDVDAAKKLSGRCGAGKRFQDDADDPGIGCPLSGDRGHRPGQPRGDRSRRPDQRLGSGRLLGLGREGRQQGSGAFADRIFRQVRSGLPDPVVHLGPGRPVELAALEEQGVRRSRRSRRQDDGSGKAQRDLYPGAEADG